MSHHTYKLSQVRGVDTMIDSCFSMNTFTVSFFGHRVIEDPLTIDSKLDALIRRLLLTKPYVEFLVGRDGDLTSLCPQRSAGQSALSALTTAPMCG